MRIPTTNGKFCDDDEEAVAKAKQGSCKSVSASVLFKEASLEHTGSTVWLVQGQILELVFDEIDTAT